jgi:hypothetical protein
MHDITLRISQFRLCWLGEGIHEHAGAPNFDGTIYPVVYLSLFDLSEMDLAIPGEWPEQ